MLQARLSPRRRLGTFRLGEEVAHNTPSGFWGFWQPTATLLAGEFDDIRDGEGGTYQACDRLLAQAAPTSGFWGHGTDVAPSTFWPTQSDQDEKNDAWRNANAWVGDAANDDCFLKRVASRNVVDPTKDPGPTNAATGSFRAVISRSLFGLSRGHVDNFDPWSDAKLAAYVDRIRERLTEDTALARNMRNACAGWFLEDDTFGGINGGSIGGGGAPGSGTTFNPAADLVKWKDMLKAVQDAQMARSAITRPGSEPINLPFFWNWEVSTTWHNAPPDPTWPVVKSGGQPASQPDPPGPPIYRKYDLPWWADKAMAKVSDPAGGSFPDDAIRCPQPYRYLWNAGDWNDIGSLPPWYIWRAVIQYLDERFDYDAVVNGEYLNRDLQIHPIMEGGKHVVSSVNVPGHIDMHAQIRVMMNMGWKTATETYEQVQARIKKRINSISVAPWNGSGWQQIGKNHWKGVGATKTERWAEAFQTEIGDDVTQPSTEGITAAQPSTTELLALPASWPGRIDYQLATAGVVRFDIELWQSSSWVVKRVIDNGYWGPSPAGYYKRAPDATLTDTNKLWGTSSQWDKYLDGTTRTLAGAGSYRIRMYVDGSVVDTKTFTI